uniref:Uncharacterized protein n=1 Tax=Meloidogyne enterolobii TaxID=390850 RepID=A0A6V7UJX1_MELEN|nr:unnamed protein product [Meloidogyne enterolobii]
MMYIYFVVERALFERKLRGNDCVYFYLFCLFLLSRERLLSSLFFFFFCSYL